MLRLPAVCVVTPGNKRTLCARAHTIHVRACRVADAFYAKLKQRAQSINIGDPLQPGCRMGPVVSAAQYERVRSYVQVGRLGRLIDCDSPASRPATAFCHYIVAICLLPHALLGTLGSIAPWCKQRLGCNQAFFS